MALFGYVVNAELKIYTHNTDVENAEKKQEINNGNSNI